MLLDANLLIYGADEQSQFHDAAVAMQDELLNGERRVGLPWQTIGAVVRIMTHPRIVTRPLTGAQAWEFVEGWLRCPQVWIPPASTHTARIFGELTKSVPISGNVVPDAMLAALAIEHGLEVWSVDADFARFPGLRWRNPLAVQ